MSMFLDVPKFLFILLLPHLCNIFTRRYFSLVEGVVPPGTPTVITGMDDDSDRSYTKEYQVHHRWRASKIRRSAPDSSTCETVSPVPPAIREEYNLDPFYTKFTQAYGIPILSSGQVSDTALDRACYSVRFLLADRADIRDSLHEGRARMSILGTAELTTQIPEYRYLDDSWNDRTRGLGGTPQNPITVAAEENLLCENASIDQWWTEDIIVHEFVHAIHLIAVDSIDVTFKDRLKDAFLNAFREGLWSNHYGGTNINEYLAEGAQSFFNVNVHREIIDDVHSDISTREALKNYDRRLYDLLLEIFPCANVILDRCSNQSLATTWPMKIDCTSHPSTSPPKNPRTSSPSEEPLEMTTVSSMSTDHTLSTPSDTDSATTPSTGSSDRDDATSTTVDTESMANVSTAMTGAHKSSDGTEVTNTDCADRVPSCSDLVSDEECALNPVKRDFCQKTCRSCPGCHDYHRLCTNLSDRGFCTTKTEYMTSVCPKSCGVCNR